MLAHLSDSRTAGARCTPELSPPARRASCRWRSWYRVDVAKRTGRWLAEGPTDASNRQFILADPDGYLWRPFRDLGVRPITD